MHFPFASSLVPLMHSVSVLALLAAGFLHPETQQRMTTARAFGRTADTRYFSIRWGGTFCLQERKKVEFVARAIVYGIMESI